MSTCIIIQKLIKSLISSKNSGELILNESSVKGDICLDKKCFHCCVETEMVLSPEDIRRISAEVKENPKQFLVKTEDGLKILKNKKRDNGDLVCFFLNEDGLCSIYDFRPKGCTFYPLIWDMKQHKVISDDYCPYYKLFSPFIKKFANQIEDFVFRLYGEI